MKQIISLDSKGFFDRITRLIKKAVPNSKTAAIVKSKGDQFQPSTKRFPKNAAANKSAGTAKIANVVFLFVIFI